MDHSSHHAMMGNHATESMAPICKMHMLWNWETVNTCIVFRSWHVSSNTTFVFSFFIIVLIGIFFEWLREVQKAYDHRLASSIAKGKVPLTGLEAPGEEALLLGRGVAREAGSVTIPAMPRLIRAVLYGLSCFISFFIMLIFMTYNGYLIAAVVVGATAGHWIFNGKVDVDEIISGVAGKGMACH